MINGTSDWVNEEEFDLRDCWRWSPDGRSIAFWQFDASGIEDFLLLNNTTGLYPTLTKIPYPKTGTQNAAVRVGVISADGGEIALARNARRPAEQLHRVGRLDGQPERDLPAAFQPPAEHAASADRRRQEREQAARYLPKRTTRGST